MQTINNQTVKIARVLISKAVYFMKSYKFNCFSTSDISSDAETFPDHISGTVLQK